MIAFDTCLLVRFLADDNPAQADLAEALMREHTVFLPVSVILETEWVLRSRYRQPPDVLQKFFSALLEMENVVLENAAVVEYALKSYKAGMDFADALHLASCKNAVLYTFDKAFVQSARALQLAAQIQFISTD